MAKYFQVVVSKGPTPTGTFAEVKKYFVEKNLSENLAP
jgi:hypothetical protein